MILKKKSFSLGTIITNYKYTGFILIKVYIHLLLYFDIHSFTVNFDTYLLIITVICAKGFRPIGFCSHVLYNLHY